MYPLYLTEGNPVDKEEGIRIYGWEILLNHKILHPSGPPPFRKGGILYYEVFLFLNI